MRRSIIRCCLPVVVGCLAAICLGQEATLTGPDPAAVRLFVPAGPGEQPGLRIDRAALGVLASAAGPTRVGVPLPGLGDVEVEVERFRITDRATTFARGRLGGDEIIDFNASRVILLRGDAPGHAGSRVYLAIGRRVAIGSIDLGPGRTRYQLSAAAGGGEAVTSISVTEGGSVTFPPVGVDTCGVMPPAVPIDPPGAPPAGEPEPGIRWLRLAIDTDHEFYQLFDDEEAALEYVIELYGAVSDIFLRDAKVYITLPFVRIWDTPDDLFNETDPLAPFMNYWNDNMALVQRDTAQLLTGRRNLPYGGVAYVSALCGPFSYSVSGYILGAIGDPSSPSFANWDLTVCAHELGHSCGTLHTHDYGIDACASGQLQRGTIMSYCHTTPGGNANIDPRFHTHIQRTIESYMATTCVPLDCNLDGQADGMTADELDANDNGVLDDCEDCNGNGALDELDILFGLSNDFDDNGVPDECEPDCNGNNIPDGYEIAVFLVEDRYGDGVPDICEADCNGNGESDYNEIQLDMSLDLDRNAVLDECQDCDGNGINDFDELAGGLNVWAAGEALDELLELHGLTGVLVKPSASFADIGAGQVQDVVLSPDGHVLVSSAANHAIAEYDRGTGAFRRWLVAAGAGGLLTPTGMTFGPNGNLFVASRGNSRVLEFDGDTGEFLGLFAGAPPDPGGAGNTPPVSPFAIAFGPDGNLFVTTGDDKVVEFDGTTGDLVGDFVTAGLGGLDDPRGLVFKPDGNLLVASSASDAILEYDGQTGAFVDRFDLGGVIGGFWGLRDPWCLRIGPNGRRLYVSVNDGSTTIHAYDLESGLFMRSYYILAQVLDGATGFDFAPRSEVDCNGNLRPDACDIADGLSLDENGDGVPDECAAFAPCFGDLAGNDAEVDDDDLSVLLAAFGGAAPAYDIAPPGGDGVIDVLDLLALLGAWGPCQ